MITLFYRNALWQFLEFDSKDLDLREFLKLRNHYFENYNKKIWPTSEGMYSLAFLNHEIATSELK